MTTTFEIRLMTDQIRYSYTPCYDAGLTSRLLLRLDISNYKPIYLLVLCVTSPIASYEKIESSLT